MPKIETAQSSAEVSSRMIFASDQQVGDRYGVSRITIWRWRKSDATFPQPINLSPGCVRWRVADLEAWEVAKAGGEAA